MPLWAKIVDGVLLEVGPRPVADIRLDTNTPVTELDGTDDQWREAGWYRVEDLELGEGNLGEGDANEVIPMPGFISTLTLEQRTALRAALVAAVQRQTKRTGLSVKVSEITDLARDVAWDWLERNGHPNLMNVPFIANQLEAVGTEWGTLAVGEKVEEFRKGMGYLFAIAIRYSQGFDLLFDALAEPITAADVDVTPDR